MLRSMQPGNAPGAWRDSNSLIDAVRRPLGTQRCSLCRSSPMPWASTMRRSAHACMGQRECVHLAALMLPAHSCTNKRSGGSDGDAERPLHVPMHMA
jgi:hypothetical protein